jgi:hypothetical protein
VQISSLISLDGSQVFARAGRRRVSFSGGLVRALTGICGRDLYLVVWMEGVGRDSAWVGLLATFICLKEEEEEGE